MGGVPKKGGACESMRLSPCVLVQPDGWARGEREGYGGPCDVTSLSLSLRVVAGVLGRRYAVMKNARNERRRIGDARCLPPRGSAH